MVNWLRTLLIGALLVCVTSFAQTTEFGPTFTVGFLEPQFQLEFARRLDAEGIPYTRTSTGSFELQTAYRDRVGELSTEVVARVIPPHRHALYGEPSLTRFRTMLDDAGIKYEIVVIQGIPYLIWSEDVSDAVNKLKAQFDAAYGYDQPANAPN